MRGPVFSNTLYWTKGWIVLSAYLSAAGWILSVAGQLNPFGYGVAVLLGLAAAVLAFRAGAFPLPQAPRARFPRRFRRFFPAVFLALLGAAFFGGALYAPTNYDALSYRIPRILHWLSEGKWHWIVTTEVRMNMSAVGMEWLMTPLFAFSHSDRSFFLLNVASFALLPGLVYAVFTRVGISKRLSWYWMWLLPSGYCFFTQAGSVGNDSYATVYLLASIALALRYRETRRDSDLWLSMVAAALLTGAKASNLPLMLPWAIAAFPVLWPLLRRKPGTATAVVAVCILGSFVPLGCLNYRYSGDWAGDPGNRQQMKLDNPVYGLIGNGLQLLVANAAPPIFPQAPFWNERAAQWLHSPANRPLIQHFPRLTLKCNEFQNEEGAGLGLGLCGLLAVGVAASVWHRPREGWKATVTKASRSLGTWVCVGGCVALAVYMAKLGSESTARLVIPYYPLVIAAALLIPGAAALPRRRWWRFVAALAALSVFPIMIFNPSRPLWPALTVCEKWVKASPGNRVAERAFSVYEVYRNRNDGLAVLRKYIEPGDRVIGFFALDASEVALWRPFGERKVVDFTPARKDDFFGRKSLLFASREAIQVKTGLTVEEWLAGTSGRLIAVESPAIKATRGAEDWYVIRFDPAR